jgi:hypothetical protein
VKQFAFEIIGACANIKEIKSIFWALLSSFTSIGPGAFDSKTLFLTKGDR